MRCCSSDQGSIVNGGKLAREVAQVLLCVWVMVYQFVFSGPAGAQSYLERQTRQGCEIDSLCVRFSIHDCAVTPNLVMLQVDWVHDKGLATQVQRGCREFDGARH